VPEGTYRVTLEVVTPQKASLKKANGSFQLTVMEVRLEQPEKALYPILVTLLGIVMEVRLEQPIKAPPPILVTPLGIVMEGSFEQEAKA
jgi:hypothetical protein